jgi:hypothetical protein
LLKIKLGIDAGFVQSPIIYDAEKNKPLTASEIQERKLTYSDIMMDGEQTRYSAFLKITDENGENPLYSWMPPQAYWGEGGYGVGLGILPENMDPTQSAEARAKIDEHDREIIIRVDHADRVTDMVFDMNPSWPVYGQNVFDHNMRVRSWQELERILPKGAKIFINPAIKDGERLLIGGRRFRAAQDITIPHPGQTDEIMERNSDLVYDPAQVWREQQEK